MCSDDRLSIGVYDGCVGMGMCVVWGELVCGVPGGGGGGGGGGGHITSLKGELNLASRPRSISGVRERIT